MSGLNEQVSDDLKLDDTVAKNNTHYTKEGYVPYENRLADATIELIEK